MRCISCHKPVTFDEGDNAWRAEESQALDALVCVQGEDPDGADDIGHQVQARRGSMVMIVRGRAHAANAETVFQVASDIMQAPGYRPFVHLTVKGTNVHRSAWLSDLELFKDVDL